MGAGSSDTPNSLGQVTRHSNVTLVMSPARAVHIELSLINHDYQVFKVLIHIDLDVIWQKRNIFHIIFIRLSGLRCTNLSYWYESCLLPPFLPSEELPDALGPVPAPDPAPATLVTVGPHHVPQHQRVAVHLPAALVQRQGLTLTATLRTLLGEIVFPTKNEASIALP